MHIQELLIEWRSTYAEWVSTELQLRAARRQKNSESLILILEEKVRAFKRQCSDCQDAASDALASENQSSIRHADAAGTYHAEDDSNAHMSASGAAP